MKRLLTITILLVPFLIHSQGLTIKSGVTFSKWTGEVENVNESRTGVAVGISYGIQLSENVMLSLGSQYLSNGTVQRDKEFDEVFNVTYNELIVVKTRNFNFPILFQYMLNEKVYLQGGPYVSFLLSDEIEATYTQCIEGNCIGEKETFESNDFFEPSTIGLDFGIGLKISKRFLFETNYLKGLSPIIDQEDPVRDQSLMFSFGYQF